MTKERGPKDDLQLAFRDWARAAAERPESFWERQRLAVRDRIENAGKRRRVLRRRRLRRSRPSFWRWRSRAGRLARPRRPIPTTSS